VRAMMNGEEPRSVRHGRKRRPGAESFRRPAHLSANGHGAHDCFSFFGGSPMNAKDAIRYALQSTQHMLPMYLEDLSDADLLVRPVPNANHIAWQLGQMISAEVKLLATAIPGAKFPELPSGFAERYTKETSKDDNPKNFLTKKEYLT